MFRCQTAALLALLLPIAVSGRVIVSAHGWLMMMMMMIYLMVA